jgi:hypothetical protein
MGKQLSSSDNQERTFRDQEMAAVVASAAILGFFVVYWILQIQEVRAMLALAYG